MKEKLLITGVIVSIILSLVATFLSFHPNRFHQHRMQGIRNHQQNNVNQVTLTTEQKDQIKKLLDQQLVLKKEMLTIAVQSGKVTQTQADQIIQFMEKRTKFAEKNEFNFPQQPPMRGHNFR